MIRDILGYLQSLILNHISRAQEKIAVDVLWFIVIVFSTVCSIYLTRMGLKRIKNKLKQSQSLWTYSLVKAAVNPMTLLIILISTILSVRVLDDFLHYSIKGITDGKLKTIAFLFCFAWLCISYIYSYQQRYIALKDKTKTIVDHKTLDIIAKLVSILIMNITGLIIMDILGLSIAGILTLAGIGGASIALAAKDLIANFFGSIMIYVDKPFSVGDSIKLDDGKEGDVEYIGWRIIQIRTPEKTQISIPNSVFANMAIENLSRITHRRIKQEFGIHYKDIDKIKNIVKDIEKFLQKHPKIDKDQAYYVSFENFMESSINLMVYAFSNTVDLVDFTNLKHDIMMEVAKVVSANGATLNKK